MFDVNGFIMKTLNGMIGKYPDFQVREYALNWYEKGKITEDDLATIDSLIEAQYVENEVVEEISEEVTETEQTNNELTEDETENAEDEYTESETIE